MGRPANDRKLTPDKLKELLELKRKIHSISNQKVVAAMLGVCDLTISRWVNGDWPIKKVYMDKINELYHNAIGGDL